MKKQYIHIIIFSVLTIFLSSCFGLRGYLTGKEAMNAKTFNEYQKNIKPELYYWNKPNVFMTEEKKCQIGLAAGVRKMEVLVQMVVLGGITINVTIN